MTFRPTVILETSPRVTRVLVRLDDNDMTFVRAEFGGRIQEVRVGNRIPKSRVTFLGTRPAGKR